MAMKVKAAILFLEEQRKRHEELYGIPAQILANVNKFRDFSLFSRSICPVSI